MACFSKRLPGASLALALLWTFAGPGPVLAQEPKADPYKTEVIARADGIPITRAELLNAVNRLIPGRAYHAASIPEYRYEEVQQEALDNLILGALIYKKAKKLDKTDPADIGAKIEEIKGRIPEGDTLETILKRSNMTMEDLKEDLEKSIVIQKVVEERTEAFKKLSSETVTEPYLKDYYEENLARFRIPAKILLRNILIKVDSSSSQRVWNEARKKTIELVKRARAGEDFAELARQNSEGPRAAEGGNMGWVQRGGLMDELGFAAYAMKKGEISGAIMTIYGYHVIKLEDATPATLMKFADIDKPKLKKKLEEREYTRLMGEWKSELRSNAKIERLNKDLY